MIVLNTALSAAALACDRKQCRQMECSSWISHCRLLQYSWLQCLSLTLGLSFIVYRKCVAQSQALDNKVCNYQNTEKLHLLPLCNLILIAVENVTGCQLHRRENPSAIRDKNFSGRPGLRIIRVTWNKTVPSTCRLEPASCLSSSFVPWKYAGAFSLQWRKKTSSSAGKPEPEQASVKTRHKSKTEYYAGDIVALDLQSPKRKDEICL
jgi:hypothetical protein